MFKPMEPLLDYQTGSFGHSLNQQAVYFPSIFAILSFVGLECI